MSSSVSEYVVEGAEGDLATGTKEDDLKPTERVPSDLDAATPVALIPVVVIAVVVPAAASCSSLESHTTFPYSISLLLHPPCRLCGTETNFKS